MDAVAIGVQHFSVLPDESGHVLPFVFAKAGSHPLAVKQFQFADGSVGVGIENKAVVQPNVTMHEVVGRVVAVAGGVDIAVGRDLQR